MGTEEAVCFEYFSKQPSALAFPTGKLNFLETFLSIKTSHNTLLLFMLLVSRTGSEIMKLVSTQYFSISMPFLYFALRLNMANT